MRVPVRVSCIVGAFLAIWIGVWSFLNLGAGTTPALRNAGERIREVEEFRRLYPDCRESIQHYLGGGASTHWVGVACIDGRFELRLHVPISLGFNKRTVDSWGPVSGWVGEVDRIVLGGISYGQNQRRFGPAEWDALVRASGDLRAIGIETEGRAPLPGLRPLLGFPE